MKILIPVFLLILSAPVSCQPVQKNPAELKANDVYTYRSSSSGGTGKIYMGREIAHVISPDGAAWLERDSRLKEENSEVSITNMNLQPDDVVADIGAGTGFYTFRIAKKVPQGKVYAVELQKELIQKLEEKKAETSAANVEIIPGDTLQVNLPEGSVDLAFMVDVYHELSWPKEVIASVRKSLKPDGRLLLIEYRGEDPAVQIRPLHKMTIEQITREMKAAGFVRDRQVDVLPIQHFIVFKKAD